MKVSQCDYFEDKGVALSGLIKKLSTKAQLDLSFVLTPPFEVATPGLKERRAMKYDGNI